MKTFSLLIISALLPFLPSVTPADTGCKNSAYILQQVRTNYGQGWETADLRIHIQEPRLGNPQRYTKLRLNLGEDYFEMERTYDYGTLRRILTADQESKIYLNGDANLPQELVDKYLLNVTRTQAHKKFYRYMYSIPMCLTDEFWSEIAPAQEVVFDGREAYQISMVLKEEMISKYWTLIVDAEMERLLALEFNHPDEPGRDEEMIIFEGEYVVDGIKLPRIRHWYIKGTEEYLGSDIIVETLE